MITLPKSVRNTACEVCPIRGSEYCHKVNPNAPKYTRSEKKELAEKLKECGDACEALAELWRNNQ